MVINAFEDIFRIACFVVFSLGVGNIISRRLIPSLRIAYARYKKYIVDKIKSQDRIIVQQKEILAAIEEENKYGKELAQKIEVWRTREIALSQKNEEQYHEGQETFRRYMAEQSRFLAVTTVQYKLMPEIIERVEKNVKDVYSKAEEQARYTDEIINSLKDA